MPYKDPKKAREFRKQYNIRTSEKFKQYRGKHKSAYMKHWRNGAWKRRGIVNRDGTPFTVVDYEFFMDVQDARCAICRIERSKLSTNFAVDHDHRTGEMRGLLCSLCDRFVVFTTENHRHLIPKALAYLRISNKNVPERIEATM